MKEIIDLPVIYSGYKENVEMFEFHSRLYPNGCANIACEGYLCFKVRIELDVFIEHIDLQGTFSILNIYNSEVSVRHFFHKLTVDVDSLSVFFRFHRFIKNDDVLNKMNGLMKKNKLSLLVRFEIINDHIKINFDQYKFKNHLKLCQDIGTLFENKDCSDVVLVANEKEFHTHKYILMARSPVFNAMFQHQMKEKYENRVEITDVEPEVLREMLKFIYTAEIDENNIQTILQKLLIAADKYALDELKVVCGNLLYQNITVDNALEIFILADVYNANDLKCMTRGYIIDHEKQIKDSADYAIFKESHNYLINQMFQMNEKSDDSDEKSDSSESSDFSSESRDSNNDNQT